MARDAILSVMKVPVGVASSHDDRGKMPLPQKKTQLQWKPNFGVALHQLEHERFANQAL
jgi:hypothetical protein